MDEITQKAFRALGDPTRFRIVEFLSHMCCGTAAVNEEGGVYDGPTASEVCCHLTGAEKINSTISHHLHELEEAGLIRIERRGKRMICALRPEALESLSDQLRLMAKSGAPCGCGDRREASPNSQRLADSSLPMACCGAKPDCC